MQGRVGGCLSGFNSAYVMFVQTGKETAERKESRYGDEIRYQQLSTEESEGKTRSSMFLDLKANCLGN